MGDVGRRGPAAGGCVWKLPVVHGHLAAQSPEGEVVATPHHSLPSWKVPGFDSYGPGILYAHRLCSATSETPPAAGPDGSPASDLCDRGPFQPPASSPSVSCSPHYFSLTFRWGAP